MYVEFELEKAFVSRFQFFAKRCEFVSFRNCLWFRNKCDLQSNIYFMYKTEQCTTTQLLIAQAVCPFRTTWDRILERRSTYNIRFVTFSRIPSGKACTHNLLLQLVFLLECSLTESWQTPWWLAQPLKICFESSCTLRCRSFQAKFHYYYSQNIIPS